MMIITYVSHLENWVAYPSKNFKLLQPNLAFVSSG